MCQFAAAFDHAVSDTVRSSAHRDAKITELYEGTSHR